MNKIKDMVAHIPGRRSRDANASNGFEAMQAVNVYQFFQEKYDDVCPVIKTDVLSYHYLYDLEEKLAEDIWQQAICDVNVASQYGFEVKLYALLMHPKSVQQKYHLGYWLQFYLYKNLPALTTMKNDESCMQKISKVYYSGNRKSILKEK